MPGETRSGCWVGATARGAVVMNDRKGKREKLSRAGVISILFFLLPLFSIPPPSPFFPSFFRPVSLSTIRYISTHPRHCFRGISSELFARDSFRAATRRLILLQCLFPPLRDIVDVTKLARIRSRIQLEFRMCLFRLSE